ncbi:MAG: voltage-gated potassium channel [Chloroflexota bacterium]|jgi:voltage-gated potassium channel|nr:voltage-gated potassium channel [Chloroflexota bacterium]
MAALAVLFVVVGFVEASSDMAPLLDAVDLTLTVVFAAEFTSRLAASRDRRAYLRGHWIDAVALIPTVRAVRLMRLLRLLRLVRVFAGMFRALSSIERFAAHRGLLALFGAWLTVAVICGAALYFAEVGQNPEVTSFGDALWWAVVTVATVGYGDVTPITPEGRLAAAVLMIVGITLWAAVTGMITSLLVSAQSAEVSAAERIRQLADLRQDELVTEAEYQAKKAELLAKM